MIFSHGKPVDPDHLRKIECIVNNQIKAELEVYAKEATVSEAKQINGLRAVFGEVYPDPVRVVSIGQKGLRSWIRWSESCSWAYLCSIVSKRSSSKIEDIGR
ncbi:Alanine--tRNA ligase [Euphorbia peplus]|nr:Alanine--tRNA ligase [Euphorbia peplus]